MTSASASAPPQRSRLARWILRSVMAVLLLVAVLALAGFSYESIERFAGARRYPAQGRVIDIGGYRLNLNCTGQGSPTVVVDSGLGGYSTDWRIVQADISKVTRICSYDRAGYGWSDAGPSPRSSAQIARELHTLLLKGGENPPFLMVGHSLGGYNVRVYNGLFPGEVAGMVLVDAAQEDLLSTMSPQIRKAQEISSRNAQKKQWYEPLLLRFGITRLTAPSMFAQGGIPKDEIAESIYLDLQPKYAEARAGEFAALNQSSSEVRASGKLGDMPLVVLTAGKFVIDDSHLPPGVTRKDLEEYHRQWVEDLQVREVHLSTRGKQIIVPDSGHRIPLERPDAIISAIREIYAALNAGASPATHAGGHASESQHSINRWAL
jgi:pimeloyl-ACP methyl ester carboxylesterase